MRIKRVTVTIDYYGTRLPPDKLGDALFKCEFSNFLHKLHIKRDFDLNCATFNGYQFEVEDLV